MNLNLIENIELTIKELNIDINYFYDVKKDISENIIKKIIVTFLEKNRFNNSIHWGWEVLKNPNLLFTFKDSYDYSALKKIVTDEFVWFIVEDVYGENLLYEGRIEEIIKILEESYYIDEYYIISNKYEWLICENHHQSISVCGDIMIDKIKLLSSENKISIKILK